MPIRLLLSHIKRLTWTSFFISTRTTRFKSTRKIPWDFQLTFPVSRGLKSFIYLNALIRIQTACELHIFESDPPLFQVQIGRRGPDGRLPHCFFLQSMNIFKIPSSEVRRDFSCLSATVASFCPALGVGRAPRVAWVKQSVVLMGWHTPVLTSISQLFG